MAQPNKQRKNGKKLRRTTSAKTPTTKSNSSHVNNARWRPPALKVGDPVRLPKAGEYGVVSATEGDRVTVRTLRRKDIVVPRHHCSFHATAAHVRKEAAKIRRSWQDVKLRERMRLPRSTWQSHEIESA
jgi:hypothetical protein